MQIKFKYAFNWPLSRMWMEFITKIKQDLLKGVYNQQLTGATGPNGRLYCLFRYLSFISNPFFTYIYFNQPTT